MARGRAGEAPMARAPSDVIRALVFRAFDDGLVDMSTGLTRGANFVRKGRWAIANTSGAPLVAVTATAEADGWVCYVGPAATIRGIVPLAVRAAWIANQFGEDDTDP